MSSVREYLGKYREVRMYEVTSYPHRKTALRTVTTLDALGTYLRTSRLWSAALCFVPLCSPRKGAVCSPERTRNAFHRCQDSRRCPPHQPRTPDPRPQSACLTDLRGQTWSLPQFWRISLAPSIMPGEDRRCSCSSGMRWVISGMPHRPLSFVTRPRFNPRKMP